MRSIKAKFIPREINKEENYEIGDHYIGICPYCRLKNWAWISEMDGRNKATGNSKCIHFHSHSISDGIARFSFQEKISIKRLPNVVKTIEIKMIAIEGISFPLNSILRILEEDGEGYWGDIVDQLSGMGYLATRTGGSHYCSEKGKELLRLLEEGKY